MNNYILINLLDGTVHHTIAEPSKVELQNHTETGEFIWLRVSGTVVSEYHLDGWHAVQCYGD